MNEQTLIIEQAKALISGEPDIIAVCANLSAFINQVLADINWVGFYRYQDGQLILGPFQGKVACTRLYPGKGVCSKAIETQETQNIPDVHQFPTHVQCDSASNSELVVPIIIDNQPWGVLDIDSPSFARFSGSDQETMEAIVSALSDHLKNG